MDAEDLRALQQPLKEAYRSDQTLARPAQLTASLVLAG